METRMTGGAAAGGSSRGGEGHAGSRGEGASVGMMEGIGSAWASGGRVTEARAGEASGRGDSPLSETSPGAEASGRSGSETRGDAVRDAGPSACGAGAWAGEAEGGTALITGSAESWAGTEAGSTEPVTGSAGTWVAAGAGALRVERVGWASGDNGAGGTRGRGAWPRAEARAGMSSAVGAACA
ncbi:hypothetical protein ACN28E_53090 [Archangium lansingense]|uniref:hypothetical protein n=1 Tax=Archangium lansingense TaxID=2995310 RepID=UPI003B801976